MGSSLCENGGWRYSSFCPTWVQKTWLPALLPSISRHASISLSLGYQELQCSFTNFTFPHYCNCSARYCNFKSAVSDNKSTEVWNLLSHLSHCGLDVLHITSGIWLLPCLSSLQIHLSWLPPMETGEEEHQGGKNHRVLCSRCHANTKY